MQRRHFEKCARIPVQVMGTYKSLKSTRPRGEGTPQEYWESSARKIGLVDSGVEGMGIRVMEDGDGGMVEQFLLQRKKVEDYDGARGVSDHYSNERTAAGAKRRRSLDNDEEINRSRDQSLQKQSETNMGQEQKTSVLANNSIDEPPPISSYSDAHLLASISMRDRTSPSLPVVDTAGMINGHDDSKGVYTQQHEV